MKRKQLVPFELPIDIGLPPHLLHKEEIRELATSVESKLPTIERLESETNECICEIAERSQFYEIDMNCDEVYASFHEELKLHFHANFSPDQLVRMTDESLVQLAEKLQDSSRKDINRMSGWELQIIVDRVKLDVLNERAGTLWDLRERFEEFKIISESGEASAPLGLMRQAFIAMMASFDAAIFDLIRIALQKDFFRLMAMVDHKLSFDCETISSWEQRKATIIEEQLKKKYVRGWIHTLNNEWKVLGQDSPGDDGIRRCIEQINRRNVILHNRGVVDEKYTKEFNLDRHQIGDHVLITEDYWNRATDVSERIIRQITRWVVDL